MAGESESPFSGGLECIFNGDGSRGVQIITGVWQDIVWFRRYTNAGWQPVQQLTTNSKFALVSVLAPTLDTTYNVNYPNGFTRDNCTIISAYLYAYNNKYYGQDNVYATLTNQNIQVVRKGADTGSYTCYVLLYRIY